MLRTIIVEPSDVMRSLPEYVVAQMLGWEFYSTVSGLQAWELVQRVQPDLVIAEGHMRDLDGLELACRMQGHLSLSSVPVVLIDVLEAEAKAAGVAATITKPFGVEALVRTLTQVLDGR